MNPKCFTLQYSTMSTVQASTVQYSSVQYSTVQYSTVQYSTVQYSVILPQSEGLRKTGQGQNWSQHD